MLFMVLVPLEALENSVVVSGDQHWPQAATLRALCLLGPDELLVQLDRAYVLTRAMYSGLAEPRVAEAIAPKVFAIARGGSHQVVPIGQALARDSEGNLAVDGADLQ